MGAEKIISINSQLELDALKAKMSIIEDIVDYSMTLTMLELKNKVKALEDEALTLRAVDAEKERLISEKEKMITELKTSFDSRLEAKTSWIRNQYEAEKKTSLENQRKNIRAREVRPKEEIVKQSIEEVERITTMYNALLEEFKTSHKNETTIINMCLEILDIVKSLASNNSTSQQIVKAIDSGIESITKRSVREECVQIHNLKIAGHSNTEIGALLYPDLTRRTQKVSERINSQTYIDMFGPTK